MKFRKYNFIVQLIYYLFFNFFCLQALKAYLDFNSKIPQNNSFNKDYETENEIRSPGWARLKKKIN